MQYRILIIGPIEALESTSLSKFGRESVDSIQIQDEDTMIALKQMSECNLIVTLKFWEYDYSASKLAKIARIAEIPVVHEINFASYVLTKND